MAYQTGTAADQRALATAVNTFLTANGWSSNRFDLQPNTTVGPSARVELQKTYVSGTATLTMCANMYFNSGENISAVNGGPATSAYFVGLFVSTTWASGQTWFNQSGGPTKADANPFTHGAECSSASIVYHIFTDSSNENVVLVVRKDGNVFNFVSWGASVTKFGTWTGTLYQCGSRTGQYVSITSGGNYSVITPPLPPFFSSGHNSSFQPEASAALRIDIDSFGEEWRSTGLSSANSACRTTRTNQGWGPPTVTLSENSAAAELSGVPIMGHIWVRSRSALTNNALLHPCGMSAKRTSGRYSPLGVHPVIRGCHVTGLLGPGAEITIGSDTWVTFGSYAVKKTP